MANPRPLLKVAPVIELARIRQIRTIEVMERDLETLDQIVATENTAVGFFCGTAGVCVSAGLCWLTASGLAPIRHIVLATVTITTFVLSAWFCAQWLLARRRRPALLRELRERAEDRALLNGTP